MDMVKTVGLTVLALYAFALLNKNVNLPGLNNAG